jgi:hypothetical protein
MNRVLLAVTGLLGTYSIINAQPIGTTYQAGTTYYDEQYRAGGARMIDYDAAGWVHVVWTKGTNLSYGRHVYYDLWDPASESFVYQPTGIQVDYRYRAGYVSQTVSADGRCYPAFHQLDNVYDPYAYACVSIDFLPRTASFISHGIPFSDEQSSLFPRIAMDSVSQSLHIVFTANDGGDRCALYYVRAIPHIGNDGIGNSIEFIDEVPWFIDSLAYSAYDISVSQNSIDSRIAITWAKPRGLTGNQYDNDLAYVVSEDGGETFSQEVNITHFAEPDWECLSGDTMECNRDTFRVYADVSTLFDEEGYLHAVFTTTNYYALQHRPANYAGQIWHWSERDGITTPIRAVGRDYATEHWQPDIGDYELVLQDPCLSCDRIAGDLFCTYSFNDTSQWSESGMPQADIWISRSSDGGLSWSQGTNVTMTDGGQNTAYGHCLDESYPSAARYVRYQDAEQILDILYLLDLDAGFFFLPGELVTNNPVYYAQVSVNTIPAEPIWDPSWPRLHVGTEDVRDRHDYVPNTATLYQNYPNPFNPETTISFDLTKTGEVRLTVYNITGQTVATLLDGASKAGHHSITFDAGVLPSGLYFYRLEAGKFCATRKMMVMK